MKSTKDLIIEAGLKVFSEKGYKSATTLEISKTAGVSEMTLFRHFETKHNLFILTVKEALGSSLLESEKLNLGMGLKEFTMTLLHEKLLVISQEINLIKMLIRETLSHNLPKDLAFTKIISNQIIDNIKNYVAQHDLDLDPVYFTHMIVGLLLRYAVIEENPIYLQLTREQQTDYLKNYLQLLNI